MKDDARYRKHIENVEGMRAISERTDVPLSREARKRMMAADRNLRELDDIDEEGADGDDDEAPARRPRNRRAKDDVVLDEAFRILSDLIRMTGGQEVPQPKGWWL